MDLSVVVPCYNEEERLPAALGIIELYLEQNSHSFELILSNDGSTDGTLSVMRITERRHPYVRVVNITPNQGKGRALAEGVKLSSGDLVLISDADFSTPIAELPKLKQAIAEGADVAIGSRAKKGAREVDQPFHRVFMGKTFNLIVQALLLPGIWDTQCGFKLFKGEVARDLFGRLTTDGFAFDVEVLWRARRAGCQVREIPVRWINSDTTRVAPIRHSAQMLKDVVRLRLGR